MKGWRLRLYSHVLLKSIVKSVIGPPAQSQCLGISRDLCPFSELH